MIIKHQYNTRMELKKLARNLGVDALTLKKILHDKIEGISLEILVNCTEVLYPDLKMVFDAREVVS